MTERKHDLGALSIIQAQAAGAESLRAAGVTDPRLEAGSLLAHALRHDRTYIIAHGNDLMTGAREPVLVKGNFNHILIQE